MIAYTMLVMVMNICIFFLGFLVGYLKFVPDSPEIIKKQLQRFREIVKPPEEHVEVGPVRHLKGEELDRSLHPEKYSEEEAMTKTIQEQLINANFDATKK